MLFVLLLYDIKTIWQGLLLLRSFSCRQFSPLWVLFTIFYTIYSLNFLSVLGRNRSRVTHSFLFPPNTVHECKLNLRDTLEQQMLIVRSVGIRNQLYYTHFEITSGPCNLIGSNWCDLFTNRTIFCFKSHLFPSQWGGYTKNKTTNQISRLV